MELKKPPFSIESEQAVLGAVLLSPKCWDDVSFLTPDDFFRHDHRTIWEAMRAAPENRDAVALMSILGDKELMIYLGELARTTPSAANAAMYAGIVRERKILREFIRECGEAISAAYDNAKPSGLIADHARKVDGLLSGAIQTSGLRHISDVAADWYTNIRERSVTGKVAGIETGFLFLDKRWGGLRDATVTVLAGRPKTGKTTLALNIAEHVSRSHPVAVFQMEMGEDEMADRLISAISEIRLDEIRGGVLSDGSMDKLISAHGSMSRLALHLDATPRQSIDYIRLNAKQFARKHGKPVIFIDYLGLMDMGEKNGNRNEAVSNTSREIKLLAKELRCPIVLLSQMNRNAEREKRKPQLSDLRDSGSIEQDADIVCFTHKDDETQDFSEIITRAIRSGSPGTDYLMCRFDVGRFETPDRDWQPPEKVKATNSGNTNKNSSKW